MSLDSRRASDELFDPALRTSQATVVSDTSNSARENILQRAEGFVGRTLLKLDHAKAMMRLTFQNSGSAVRPQRHPPPPPCQARNPRASAYTSGWASRQPMHGVCWPPARPPQGSATVMHSITRAHLFLDPEANIDTAPIAPTAACILVLDRMCAINALSLRLIGAFCSATNKAHQRKGNTPPP
jgi:hypothetical protein